MLISGIASLILSSKELNLIKHHYQEKLRCLIRIQPRTPRCVVYFLAGSLPGSALVHLRQLTLFGMICRLHGNILHTHANNLFSAKTISKKSWFHQVRNLCLLYDLPHPSLLLEAKYGKSTFKMMIKKKIFNFYEQKLREEASNLPSLSYFHPEYMTLLKPHPLFTTAGFSPYKVAMSSVQAIMLSGRYRCGHLTRHWSKTETGHCSLSSRCVDKIDDLPHILRHCPALSSVRANLYDYTLDYTAALPNDVRSLILFHCDTRSPSFCVFLLDCSCLPDVIILVQKYGSDILKNIFEVTRTWTFTLHRERLKLLDRWSHVRL